MKPVRSEKDTDKTFAKKEEKFAIALEEAKSKKFSIGFTMFHLMAI